MAFKFEKKDARKKGVGSSMDDKAMASRLEQEAKRYKDATDSETWSCLCFRTPEDLEAFYEKVPVPRRRFITGEELRAATEKHKPEKKRRGFPRQPLSMAGTPDPLGGVEYTGDLEADCIAEAMALLEAFRNVERPEPCHEATDSDIWVCAVFANREDSEAYLDDVNLRKHGDKYIDASAWLEEL